MRFLISGLTIETRQGRADVDLALQSIASCTSRRVAGIEPASSPWQGGILPLDHTRLCLHSSLMRMSAMCARRHLTRAPIHRQDGQVSRIVNTIAHNRLHLGLPVH